MSKSIFLFALLLILLLISYSVNLWLYPLYLEEPRRALIALEMIFSGNYIVPTEIGKYYYKKPPIFNWLIIGMYRLLGSYHEIAGRIITITSLILLGISQYFFTKKYLPTHIARYAALFFLVSVDIYFHFSLLGEIDIFYSLLTYWSLCAIFHYFQTKQFTHLFIVSFFFAALGFLTKGLPSLLFLYITLFFYFLTEKSFRQFFTLPHVLGILVFALLVGSYFLIYHQYNSIFNYIGGLWFQSKTMTVLENEQRPFLYHFLTFPLDNIKSVSPAFILIILFAFRKGAWKQLIANDLIRYSLIVFFSNILVYWVSPGSRPKYVYMLYPFLITVIVYGYFQVAGPEPIRKKLFHILVGLLIVVIAGACAALPFIKPLEVVSHIRIIAVGGFIYCVILLLWFSRYKQHILLQLLFLIVGTRIVFDLTILPVRSVSDTLTTKQDALQMAALTEKKPLYLWDTTSISLETVFYLERERLQTLTYSSHKNCQDFFIASQQKAASYPVEVLYTFDYQGKKYVLFRFKNC
jgi:4-amino-4-deoxy-L-arabinose transferase-like glycosyltransferase